MGDGPTAGGLKSPAVSVILPIRNGVRTIRLAVESILAQSFADFELIILNDGSTDGTAQILHDITDPRVRVVDDDRSLGLAARLNQGVALARGAYIARMDADDVAFPTRIQRQVEYLNKYLDIDLLAARAVVFHDDGKVIGALPYRGTHRELMLWAWAGIPMPHPTWMGRREWFVRHAYRNPEVKRAEDQELLLRAALDSRYACLPDFLLGYRQGTFQLEKTLIARRHLLAAQWRIFVGRGQYAAAMGAVVLTGMKIVVDLLSAFPFCQGLFFYRMTERNLPEDAVKELRELLRHEKRAEVI